MFLVVIFVYSLTDRTQIFNKDTLYTKFSGSDAINYQYQKWEEFGYLDRVDLVDYCAIKYTSGSSEYTKCVVLPAKAEVDDLVNPEIAEFRNYYAKRGYNIIRLEPKTATSLPYLFAAKDYSPFQRLWSFFSNIIFFDGKNYLDKSIDIERYVKIQKDPLSHNMPAVVCSGCKNKYLLYFDNRFPFVHQNWVSLNMGRSFPYPSGDDILELWTNRQGEDKLSNIQYPKDIAENTGQYVQSADNLHKCTYMQHLSEIESQRFLDNYAKCEKIKKDPSRLGYSFIIGIIATVLTYLLGVPIGIMMARYKNKLFDKIGIIYIVFVMAVPSLAYIYLFQLVGGKMGLPTDFALKNNFSKWLLYVLPIVSLVLPSIAGIMKWIRRYMIDQMNSDYVKFARAKGLSEGEIFSKHILKNAMIPIVHGIPGSILGCLTGSLIMEKVYNVPGIGREFTNAITYKNNSEILALTLFFAILSITSLILGDILMAIVDPRISFASSGGRK